MAMTIFLQAPGRLAGANGTDSESGVLAGGIAQDRHSMLPCKYKPLGCIPRSF